jgi:hypothetical protein
MTAENSAALLSGRWSTQERCLSRKRKFINVFAVSKRTDRFSRKLGLSGSTPAERLRPAMQSNENRKALEMSNEKMREAVAIVLEGWTLPDGVRKILETAYYSTQSALSQSPVDTDGEAAMKYCDKCGLGEREWMACDHPDCGRLVAKIAKMGKGE